MKTQYKADLQSIKEGLEGERDSAQASLACQTKQECIDYQQGRVDAFSKAVAYMDSLQRNN